MFATVTRVVNKGRFKRHCFGRLDGSDVEVYLGRRAQLSESPGSSGGPLQRLYVGDRVSIDRLLPSRQRYGKPQAHKWRLESVSRKPIGPEAGAFGEVSKMEDPDHGGPDAISLSWRSPELRARTVQSYPKP